MAGHTRTTTSVHVFPVRPRPAYRQLAHDLALPEVLHLCADEVPQALEVKAALRPRAHQQVAPDARGGDRILDRQLHRPVQSDHLLHEVVGAGVDRVGPCDSDGEPPAEGLRIQNVSILSLWLESEDATHAAIWETPLRVRVVRGERAIR